MAEAQSCGRKVPFGDLMKIHLDLAKLLAAENCRWLSLFHTAQLALFGLAVKKPEKFPEPELPLCLTSAV